MRSKKLKFGRGFKVLFGNDHAQAASMVIEPGDSEGDAGNRHRGADQWLFVVEGMGVAIVNGKRIQLGPCSLLLIERGDRHQIRCTGRKPLRTLNLYVPPAYRADGEELPRGRR